MLPLEIDPRNHIICCQLFIPDHTCQLEEVVVAPDVEVVGVADKGHHVRLYLSYVGCCQTFLKHVGELVAVYLGV